MSKVDFLDDSFLDEIFKASLKKRDFFQVINKEMNIKFLPEKSGHREVWKMMKNLEGANSKMPSIGTLSQYLSDEVDALQILGNMKRVVLPDYQSLITAFASFVKRKKFIMTFDSVVDKWQNGETELALEEYIKSAEELAEFSLNKATHTKVFRDFNRRESDRANREENATIPTGIDMLDYYTWGGLSKTETTLFLGDSGTGKSQLLLHLCISAARRGNKVALFQAEGTKNQVLDRIDANWTGRMYRDVKHGLPLSQREKKKLQQKSIKLSRKGEIYVEAREQFGSWSMIDIRNSLIEMFKLYGEIDMVVIDYLDLIEPGDGKNYSAKDERHRQQATARAMKNIATEFGVSVVTVTQASAVPDEARQNPEFFLTRWNLSEDKGKLRPFDNFITINQTRDEKKEGICRLFVDKLREKASDQIIPLAQNLARARFYDRMRTLRELYTEEVLYEIGADKVVA